MKVALLLSGHFRDARGSFPSINKRILQPYSPDVFISTWNPDDNSRMTSSIKNSGIEDTFSYDEILKNYLPRCMKSEDFNSPGMRKIIDKAWELDLYGPMNGEISPVSILSMWYKINSCLKLMEEFEQSCNFKYDFIIKGRFDIQIHDDLEIGEIKNVVNIPPGFDWREGFNDILAWGCRDSMVHYCSLHHKIEDYVKRDGVFFHPETMLKHHLVKSSFGVDRPNVRVSLRDKNVWETESYPNNKKI